jgi:hypothetical protein
MHLHLVGHERVQAQRQHLQHIAAAAAARAAGGCGAPATLRAQAKAGQK